MDCCGEEGAWKGDAKFEVKKVADGVHVAVAAPAYKVNCDMVAAVREEAATGATLDEVKQRVTAKLAPVYERRFSAYGDYRPWRTGLAANVERTFAMVS